MPEENRSELSIMGRVINKLEHLRKPESDELELIRKFVGDKAFDIFGSLGMHVAIPQENFHHITRPILDAASEEKSYRSVEALYFSMYYKGRKIDFTCFTTRRYPTKENIEDSSMLGPLKKTLKIDFAFEKDELKSTPMKAIKKALYRAGKVSIIRAMQLEDKSERKFLSQTSKDKNIGLHAESMSFLQNMHSFIKAIDPECTVNITALDEQRFRIYSRAFRDMSNIKISLHR